MLVTGIIVLGVAVYAVWAVRKIRKLGARNGVPGEANAAGRNERRRNA